MKFIHLSCIALIGITVVNSISTTAKPIGHNKQSNSSFSSLCKQKHALRKETKYTVQILLQKAGTQNCDRAEKILNKRKILEIGRAHV